MARRSRRQKPFWTKRKIRGIVAVGLVVWIVLALEVPATTYDSLFGTKRVTIDGTYALHIPGLPPVKYSADINYTTNGDFSAGTGNPIHMSALVYDANRSDFGDVYAGIGLLFQQVQLSTTEGIVPQFQPAGQGNWTADGTVDFYQPVNFTGPVLSPLPGALPKNASVGNSFVSQITSQVEAYNYPFPQLRPQSYTNDLSAEESILRYGAAGSAIILVFLLPVFDGVILPEEGQQDSEE